jgi:hypothetical protein
VYAATWMYYVRNRWYDPQQGRFISEDPIGLAGGINQYAYVGNNPVIARDPTGLSPCMMWLIASYMSTIYISTYLQCEASVSDLSFDGSIPEVPTVRTDPSPRDGGSNSRPANPGGSPGSPSLSDRCHSVMDPAPNSQSGPVLFGTFSGTVAAGLGGYVSGIGVYWTASGDWGISQVQGTAAGIDISADLHMGLASSMGSYAGAAYQACGGVGALGGCAGGSSSGGFISGGPSWGVPPVNGSVGGTWTDKTSLRQVLADMVCR